MAVLGDALARRFGADARGLAALRVAIGLLVLLDLALRARDLVAFYTDRGVLPRALLFDLYPTLGRLSIHALSGATWVQVALFLVTAGAALALAVGVYTRVATALTLLLVLSLHARNPVVLNAGDSLLRRLLLWGVFLPLGRRWSLDALRAATGSGADGANPGDRPDGAGERVATVATAALLVQVVLVYFVNGLFKLRGRLWLRGDAIRHVFSLDQLTVGPGKLLGSFPTLLTAFDRVWLGLVLGSWLLLVLRGRARTLLVAAFGAAHLGMALTLNLGPFPLVSIAALVPFLPAGAWDRLAPRFGDRSRALERRGRRLAARLPGGRGAAFASVPWGRRIRTAVVASLLVSMLVWNAATLGYVALPEAVSSSVDPAEYRWDVFAPDPRGTDGWYVAPGRLDSGRQVDAFHGGAVDWDRPPDVASSYPTHRWLVYLLELQRPANAALRPGFVSHLCRCWSARSGSELRRVTVYYVEQPTRLEGPEPTRRVRLIATDCPVEREPLGSRLSSGGIVPPDPG